MVWLQFLACSAAIVFAGHKLSEYGDVIADKTGLGRGWIGVALLASVTSLPELFTGVSSVTLFDVPDIAAGSVLGSCTFNLLILALVDAMAGETPISSRAHQGHVVAAGFGVLMLGLTATMLVAGDLVPAIGWVSTGSLALLATYCLAMRVVFLNERKRMRMEMLAEKTAESPDYEDVTLRQAAWRYTGYSMIVVLAATYLPGVGEEIAEITGLGETVIGSVLIALVTSLPELVVSIAALRIGAVDMVMGNLLGSNLFNIGILAVDDIFYTAGPLPAAIESTHLATIWIGVMMTAVAIIGLTYRATKKPMLWAWDSVGMAVCYAAGLWLLYELR